MSFSFGEKMSGAAVGDCDGADEVDMMSVESEGVDEVGMANGNASNGEDAAAGVGVSGIIMTEGGAEVGKDEGEVQSIAGDEIGDGAGDAEIRCCGRIYGFVLPHTLASFLPPNTALAKLMS